MVHNEKHSSSSYKKVILSKFRGIQILISGGGDNFRGVNGKPQEVPPNKRAVLVFDIPMDWIEKHLDETLHGNQPNCKERLSNRSEYESFTNNDQQYYQFCELRVNSKVPAKFITGYMIR